MTAGLTMTVVFQCMFLIHYSHLDLSHKVVVLHLNVHMHLAQGQFIHFFCFDSNSFWHIQQIIFTGSFWLVIISINYILLS